MGNTEDDSKSFVVTVEATNMPAKGSITKLDTSTKVNVGDIIICQATVKNIGEESGSFTVLLTQSGATKGNSGAFTLAPGAVVAKTFELIAATAGTITYMVRLNRMA